MESLQDRMRRLADERERIEAEEASMRSEAMAELEQLNIQIAALEARKAELEELVGVADMPQRAARGEIMNLCFTAVADSPKPLSSAEVREILEHRHPDLNLRSVPSTLSRLVSLGRMTRDQSGRYSLA